MNILKKLQNSPEPLVTRMEDFPYDWIYCGIRIENSLVAYICIRCIDKPCSDFDLAYTSILVKVLSIVMQKLEVFQKPTGQANEYFLKTLLEDGRKDKVFIENRLMHLGEKPHPYNHILIINTGAELSRRSQKSLSFRQIKTIFPEVLMTSHKENLVILLRTDSEAPFGADILERITTYLNLNSLKAVISYPYTELKDTNLYYRQALNLLPEGSLFTENTPLVFYEDHYLDDLFLQALEAGRLETMIHPHISRIINYDKIQNTEYLKTLQSFFRNNRNAAAAARDINIHRSTLFYRLSRLSALFGFDENDGPLLFSYEFSLKLIDHIQNKGMTHDA